MVEKKDDAKGSQRRCMCGPPCNLSTWLWAWKAAKPHYRSQTQSNENAKPSSRGEVPWTQRSPSWKCFARVERPDSMPAHQKEQNLCCPTCSWSKPQENRPHRHPRAMTRSSKPLTRKTPSEASSRASRAPQVELENPLANRCPSAETGSASQSAMHLQTIPRGQVCMAATQKHHPLPGPLGELFGLLIGSTCTCGSRPELRQLWAPRLQASGLTTQVGLRNMCTSLTRPPPVRVPLASARATATGHRT